MHQFCLINSLISVLKLLKMNDLNPFNSLRLQLIQAGIKNIQTSEVGK